MGRLSLLLALLLASVACGLDFDPPSLLSGSPRILALRAEPPEVRLWETATLDALVWPLKAREGAPAVDSWAWRACLLTSSLAGGMALGSAGDRLATSCFDLDEALPPEEYAARSWAGREPPDLTTTALDLGGEPTVDFELHPYLPLLFLVPRADLAPLAGVLPLDELPPPVELPSSCFQLAPDVRGEQGGRELWVTGIRLTVSLRVEAGGQAEVANKRLVLRSAPDTLLDEEDSLPFRRPFECKKATDQYPVCARNDNPGPPRLETPNGEWDGEGPITVPAGDRVKLRPLPPEEVDQQWYVAMRTCGEQLADPDHGQTGGEYGRRETRYWAWYVDAGTIQPTGTTLGDGPGTRDATWQAPEGPGMHTLYVVERDARGGVSWGDEWRLRVEAGE